MKVLIDISEEDMDKVKHSDGALFADVYRMMANTIQNAIPLNGTNGEVFGKIMDYMFMDDAYITTDRRGYLHLRGVKDDWWNAEYKGENEGI